MGDETYQRENAAFRDLGKRHRLLATRGVLIETLDALSERFSDELPAEQTGALRDRLVQSHKRAVATPRPGDGRWSAHRAGGGAGQKRVVEIRLRRVRRAPAGLRRLYLQRGRRSMRAAAAEPSDEHLHEWRKRAKDLWHALQILRQAAPKRMQARAKRAHRLSDVLGDDHDLAVLRVQVARTAFPADEEATRTALLSVIDRRRSSLQREAFKLGARVYTSRPGLARAVARRWQKRAAKHPEPIAGKAQHRRWQPVTRSSASSPSRRSRQPMPRHPVLQGYLPLATEETRLRVRRKGNDTVLTVKRGRGWTVESGVAISADVFETLWPLTESRRIEKTRYELPARRRHDRA